MELPPGPRHLLGLLPSLAIPCAVVFSVFTLLRIQGFGVSAWLGVPAVLLVRVALFVGTGVYNRWRNKRAAAAIGAVISPTIEGSSLSIIKAMSVAITHGHPCELIFHYHNIYGNVYHGDLFNQIMISTSEPEHIKAVLSTQFESFEKGPVLISQLRSLLGTGVFNADGEMWKFHRAITRPFFTKERISDFDIYHRNSELCIQSAQNRIEEGFPVNMQDLISRFTLDSATEFLCGSSVESLKATIPYPASANVKAPASVDDSTSVSFVNAFIQGQIYTMDRFGFSGDWPLSEFWKDRVKPKRKIIDEFIQPLMKQALECREKQITSGEKPKDEEFLLASLVNHTQDPTILKDELVNLLVAGRDTAASLLTFCVYMLTQHPEIEKRLREEIFNTVGPASSPTYEHMREMKYVRAYINEVLRLYPPVPANVRSSKNDTTLPPGQPGGKPIYVPAGATILYSVMTMQRRTDLWGPDAMEFDPDRFIDERLHKYLVPNPFIFAPFNAGPRICLGQQFAYHETTFFLVRLLQNFTGFTLDDKANMAPPSYWATTGHGRVKREKIYPSSHLTMYVKGGLWVNMKALNSEG